jgi:hypothetical protein
MMPPTMPVMKDSVARTINTTAITDKATPANTMTTGFSVPTIPPLLYF